MDGKLKLTYFDASGLSLEQLETVGDCVASWQRGVNWWIGDIARHAEAKWPDRWQQIFPAWISPGLVDRCKAVAQQYPRESDRNEFATWTQHMHVANDPDRLAIVQRQVEQGLTSDEAREQIAEERRQAKAAAENPKRWLLCIDVNYYVHRFWHSGAGVETASGVSSWVERTVYRLKAKGLTDAACCFDAPTNHRKELTKTWDDKYKARPPKDVELVNQLHLTREWLVEKGFATCSIDGMEADDLMSSFAAQFDGNVTLLTQDKDCRQCLSDRCNILLDVVWQDNDLTGQAEPVYQWVSAKSHTEATGIPPDKWVQYQALMGDNVDGIKGAVGIGKKGAADLIQQYGSAAAAIEWARNDAASITPKKRQALIDFADKLETTLALVTLRTDLPLEFNTRLT